MESKFHEKFYSFAKYYDIAFDFRDVTKECHFLESVFLKYSCRPLTSFVEFGAGPATHCLEMAKKLLSVTAVDLSQDMVKYASTKAKESNRPVNFECADMISYQSEKVYDMAALLMDSASYLLTNDQVIQHLRSVAKVLSADGIYVLEMSHPKSVFDIAKTALNEWEMERDNIKVKVQWGRPDDVFDPITQLTNVSVTLEYHEGERNGVLHENSLQRCFTATEFAALVAASGVFEIAGYFGGMSMEIPFSSEKRSWRMVPVLRKVNDTSS
jgi:SAM-dependent methyltransferase